MPYVKVILTCGIFYVLICITPLLINLKTVSVDGLYLFEEAVSSLDYRYSLVCGIAISVPMWSEFLWNYLHHSKIFRPALSLSILIPHTLSNLISFFYCISHNSYDLAYTILSMKFICVCFSIFLILCHHEKFVFSFWQTILICILCNLSSTLNIYGIYVTHDISFIFRVLAFACGCVACVFIPILFRRLRLVSRLERKSFSHILCNQLLAILFLFASMLILISISYGLGPWYQTTAAQLCAKTYICNLFSFVVFLVYNRSINQMSKLNSVGIVNVYS